MASLLFVITISFVISTGVSALLLPLITRGKSVSLSWSFIVTQLALAFLVIPLASLATFIWHLLPVYGILYVLPSLILYLNGYLLYSSAFVIFTNVYENLSTNLRPFLDRLSFFSPFDISENFKESWHSFFTSVNASLANIDYSEVFQNVTIQDPEKHLNPDSGFVDGFVENAMREIRAKGIRIFEFDEIRKNLTISEETEQYLDVVNVAVISFTENLRVENIFNVTRLPPYLKASLRGVTEAIYLFAKELNFTEILQDGIVPLEAQDQFNQVKTAVNDAIVGTDLKELYNTTVLMPAKELNLNSSDELQLMSFLNDPLHFVMSSASSTDVEKAWPWREIVHKFVSSAWRQLGLVILLLLVAVPVAFILRAAMQDGALWLVTRRYRFVSAQRSASGWMFVAALSGFGLALSQAFPICCIFLYLTFSSGKMSSSFTVSLIFHALKGAPLRAASHMRVVEGAAENDILEGRGSGLKKAVIVSAVFNSMFFVWWLFSSLTLLLYGLFPRTAFVLGVTMLIDIFVIGCSIGWGRRICVRLDEKERQRREARERKQD